ncbi:hypothetical protein JOB18_037659 [Solea senegalensis]|uniref:Uncharacterized protein n=1 Tax=Solea senegalensis TaxID=28829 RepID=A0AAV6R958_SOLSE|nr:hypothetical protein JOB18_037659 [Solea senegalensis]
MKSTKSLYSDLRFAAVLSNNTRMIVCSYSYSNNNKSVEVVKSPPHQLCSVLEQKRQQQQAGDATSNHSRGHRSGRMWGFDSSLGVKPSPCSDGRCGTV